MMATAFISVDDFSSPTGRGGWKVDNGPASAVEVNAAGCGTGTRALGTHITLEVRATLAVHCLQSNGCPQWRGVRACVLLSPHTIQHGALGRSARRRAKMRALRPRENAEYGKWYCVPIAWAANVRVMHKAIPCARLSARRRCRTRHTRPALRPLC